MIDVSYERSQHGDGEGFADAVTYSWGDPASEVYGMARLGLSGAGDGRRASVLAVLFDGREPVAAFAEGELRVDAAADWADLAVAGARTTVSAPLERWTVAWDAGGHGFDLEFTAVSAPAVAAKGVVELGGMAAYEQIARVRGEAVIDGRRIAVDGSGQRGHQWGVADWSGLALVRNVGAWIGDGDGAILLSSLRPAGAEGHDEELVSATLVEAGEPVAVADPRLSTTYDGDGHQRRAGMELWPTDEADYPERAAGEVICGSTLDLGALRLELAFMRWHRDGREGIGRYDILRRRAIADESAA